MSTRLMRLGVALGLAIAVPAFGQEAPSADTVLARVGDSEITLGHMIAAKGRLPDQYREMPDDVLFPGLLDQLIQQEALAQQAGEPTPRVERAIENERRALMAGIALQSVASEATTDEAVQQAYETMFGGAEPATEYNASHILVETEEEAQAIAEELEGGADFADLARERSSGPSASSGGDLGWFGPGMMVPAFEQAVSGLEPGGVTEPFQTQFGWHVARLNETREQQPPTLEEVRPQLVEKVQRDAVAAAAEGAAETVEVERTDVSGIDPSVLSDDSLLD